MTAEVHEFFSGKRLVIFGAGYVGSAMAQEGLSRGMSVTALTRNEAKAEVLRQLGAQVVVADLADSDWHDRIPGRADFVLNCVSSGGGGVTGYEHSYLGGMKSVVAWAEMRGAVGTMVYTSSTSVYPQSGGMRVDEASPIDTESERPRVLIAAEESLRDVGARAAARWFILRLAGIYGPGRHHLLQQVRSGVVAGRGDHHLNLVHRDDICSAIWAAFRAPEGIRDEVFNVTDDGVATKAEIVSWIAGEVGTSAPPFTGEPAAGRRHVTPDRIISNAKLKRILGWSPRYPSFREGYAPLLRA